MKIEEIRKMTGLSQAAFARHYQIPLDTIKGWEAETGSSRHRNCPEYVKALLDRVVREDFGDKKSELNPKGGS